jgi:hypothetical protein
VRSGLYEALSPQKSGLGEKDRLVGDAEDSRMSEYVTEEKSLIPMRRNRRGVSCSGYYRGPVGSPMADKSLFQFERVNNAFGVFRIRLVRMQETKLDSQFAGVWVSSWLVYFLYLMLGKSRSLVKGPSPCNEVQ